MLIKEIEDGLMPRLGVEIAAVGRSGGADTPDPPPPTKERKKSTFPLLCVLFFLELRSSGDQQRTIRRDELPTYPSASRGLRLRELPTYLLHPVQSYVAREKTKRRGILMVFDDGGLN